MSYPKNQFAKKSFLSLLAAVFIILGITLILVCWRDVVIIFRGALGILLAISGLGILYSIRN